MEKREEKHYFNVINNTFPRRCLENIKRTPFYIFIESVVRFARFSIRIMLLETRYLSSFYLLFFFRCEWFPLPERLVWKLEEWKLGEH